MKAQYFNKQADIRIDFNLQIEQILSPDKSAQLLPCEECLELCWVDLNVVSFYCVECEAKKRMSDVCEKTFLNNVVSVSNGATDEEIDEFNKICESIKVEINETSGLDKVRKPGHT